MWHDVPFEITFKLSIEDWQGGKTVALGFTNEGYIGGGYAYKDGCSFWLDPSGPTIGISTRESEGRLYTPAPWLAHNDSGYVQSSSATISGVQYLTLSGTGMDASHNSGTAPNAVDNNNSTYWHLGSPQGSNPLPYWLKYDFGDGNATVIKQYKLRTYQLFGPREWLLEASNDDTNWEILDHQRYQDFPTSTIVMYYPCNNDTAYRYYRIYFIKLGNNPSRPFRITEWGLSEDRYMDYYIKFSSEGSEVHRDHREQISAGPTKKHSITYRAEVWADAIDGLVRWD
jgi:hypothetical protein